MQSKMLNATLKIAATACALLLAGVSSAQTVDVYLDAQSFEKTIDDGNGGSYAVRMWGFAQCPNDTFTGCAAPTSPGPRIDATVGNTVNITVRNSLSNVPVSIIIPGQGGGGDPTRIGATSRVESMTQAADPGGTATYSFTVAKPGTFIYQSASYSSIEVPMGLYGALVVNVAPGQAYTDVSYDAERLLLFSEVDPIQNARVDAAALLAPPTTDCIPLSAYADPMDPLFMATGYPCTLDYNPAFLLVNGEPTVNLADADSVGQGAAVLLRLANAGLRSHTPSIVGIEMGLVAEDGNRYPGERAYQSAVLLAAGKTIDALVTAPAADTEMTFFDRMPTFSNETLPNGGSLGTVQVGAGVTPPGDVMAEAMPDSYIYNEDNPLTGKNVLDNDIGLSGALCRSSKGPQSAVRRPSSKTAPSTSMRTRTATPRSSTRPCRTEWLTRQRSVSRFRSRTTRRSRATTATRTVPARPSSSRHRACWPTTRIPMVTHSRPP